MTPAGEAVVLGWEGGGLLHMCWGPFACQGGVWQVLGLVMGLVMVVNNASE
mgnify:CR=1 FL=1